MSKVYINEQGLFLHVSECSSHSPDKTFSHSWCLLTECTVFEDHFKIGSVNWKEQSKKPKIVKSMQAEEVRFVTLIGATDGN